MIPSAKKLLVAFLLCAAAFHGSAQNLNYARSLVDTLASKRMSGRGYVNNANQIAAGFIVSQMEQHGLQHFSEGFLQPFAIPMNTFPGDVELSVNRKVLVPGADFIVSGDCPAVKADFKIKVLDNSFFTKPHKLYRLEGKNLKETVLLINKTALLKEYQPLLDSLVRTNYAGAAGFILVSEKDRLVWSVASGFHQRAWPVFEVLKPALPPHPEHVSAKVEPVFEPDMNLRNVIGFIPGTEVPDSFLVVTAHFDHLGMMGTQAVFPGASDNASGVAMMLDLAAYFASPGHQPRYSMAFMAFSGEEAGLKGSEYYADHPMFPLSEIAFLINLDMVGTGSEGITVVNSTVFTKHYDRLVKINADNEYLMTVTKRGESCNSDHCPFYRKGVPAIFIYSKGKEDLEYHNIYDTAQKLPMTEYEDIFRLMRDFIESYR